MQALNKILILSVLILTNTTACTTMAIGGGGHAQGSMQSDADADIVNQVNRVLVKDSSVPATDIRVSSHNGVVTLRGEVASRAVADQAIRITRSVKGVTSVTSQLHVRQQ